MPVLDLGIGDNEPGLRRCRLCWLAVCKGSVPARRFGSGSYATLGPGLGGGVDPVGFATAVGESSVSFGGAGFEPATFGL